MPAADYSSYHQPNATAADGTKFDNFIDAVQATVNGLDKNNLASNAGILAAQLADPTTGKVLGSAASACAAVFPPGFELAYVEVASNQTSTATTAATATSIVSAGAVTFDGTPVFLEFFCPYATHSVATTLITFEIYDGASDNGVITQAASGSAGSTGQSASGRRRFTPSAGSHTYSIRMWSSGAGTTTAFGGSGGGGLMLPFYIRITKA